MENITFARTAGKQQMMPVIKNTSAENDREPGWIDRLNRAMGPDLSYKGLGVKFGLNPHEADEFSQRINKFEKPSAVEQELIAESLNASAEYIFSFTDTAKLPVSTVQKASSPQEKKPWQCCTYSEEEFQTMRKHTFSENIGFIVEKCNMTLFALRKYLSEIIPDSVPYESCFYSWRQNNSAPRRPALNEIAGELGVDPLILLGTSVPQKEGYPRSRKSYAKPAAAAADKNSSKETASAKAGIKAAGLYEMFHVSDSDIDDDLAVFLQKNGLRLTDSIKILKDSPDQYFHKGDSIILVKGKEIEKKKFVALSDNGTLILGKVTSAQNGMIYIRVKLDGEEIDKCFDKSDFESGNVKIIGTAVQRRISAEYLTKREMGE